MSLVLGIITHGRLMPSAFEGIGVKLDEFLVQCTGLEQGER